MAEFTYNPIQIVEAGQSAILNTSIACQKGYIFHRSESGIVILRGIVNNPCSNFARYFVSANCNIAIPTGGTIDEISVALAIDGEPIQTSRARVTPAAADQYQYVSSVAYITVPVGCCFSLTLENTSTQAINMQNLNMPITRTA